MLFEEEAVWEGAVAEPLPFFAVLLLGLAERLGVTAGNGIDRDGASRGLDGWVIRLDRNILLLTTPGGLWQADPGVWNSWDAPEIDWQLLPFAAAPEAFERAVAASLDGVQAIVTIARPLLSLPDRSAALATLLESYVPPLGTDPWTRGNRQLHADITGALPKPEA